MDIKKLLATFEAIESEPDTKVGQAEVASTACDCGSYDCSLCFPDDLSEDSLIDIHSNDDDVDTVLTPDSDDVDFDFGDELEFDVSEPSAPEYGNKAAEPDVSELIGTIDEYQSTGQSNSPRTYDIDKLMNMSPAQVMRIYNRVVGDEVTEADMSVGMDDTELDDLSSFPTTDASEDVSDLIAEIEYLQDIGLSAASAHYSKDQLYRMSPEQVHRIHARVTADESEPVLMAEDASGVIVDRNRSDGQVIVKRGHSRVKISRGTGGYNISKMAGGLIDHATTEEEAIQVASEYLMSGNALVESKIVFRSADEASAAMQKLELYGYDMTRVDPNTIDVDAPEIVVNKIADMYDASVQYAYAEDTGAGGIAMSTQPTRMK